MTESLLAIDVGTSSTKLLLVSRDGTILARRRLPHATHRPTPGAAEQNATEWWANLVTGTAELQATIPDARIAGIGVTGQMHGVVLHDANGNVLRPAITWEDRRSADLLMALQEHQPDHPTVAPGYQAASWHWLAANEPDTISRVAHLLLPKDEIVFRLTGRHVTDPSDAIGTGWSLAGARWHAGALAMAGIVPGMLPEIAPSGAIAGPLTMDAAATLGLDAGIPVVVAGGDAAVAAFGAGATALATPLILLSTGCQSLQPAESMPESEAWPSANPAGMPRWLRAAATLNGGNVVDWARETFGEPAAQAEPDLTFLPYLAGERSDSLDAGASGAFVGLRTRHNRHDMSRAAIDGVSLALADAFERAGGEIGDTRPVLTGGGGTRDEAWLRCVADALGRPVAAIGEPDLSAWGAGRSTATALGWIDPVASPATWRPAARIVESDVPRAAAIDRLAGFRAIGSRVFGGNGD